MPLASRAETDKKTERLWKSKCASCHGADGKGQTEQGQKMAIADFSAPAWQQSHSDAKVKAAIEDGVNREKNGKKQEMDPFKDKLEAAQVEALVGYIKGLK